MNAHSDTRLTAYALGELDAAEREAFECDLAASPELQAELTATIQLCDNLMKTLPDPADSLTAGQREALRASASAPAPGLRGSGRRPVFIGALAASVALALGIWTLTRPAAEKSPREGSLVNGSQPGGQRPDAETAVGASPAIEQPVIGARGTAAINRKLAEIRIPGVNFREATVGEALDFIMQRARALDTTEPDENKRGINVVLKLDPATQAPNSVPRITLAFTDIPLGEALKYVAVAAGMKISVEPYAVAVVPLNAATDVLITKEYKVSPGFLANLSGSKATAPGGTDSRPVGNPRAREILAAAGMTFPPGASANYLPGSGKLIVRNTQANLDLIDATMEITHPQPVTTGSGKSPASADIPQKLAEAQSFFDTGRYDLAYKRSEEVLNLDRSNIAARRLMEKVTTARATYAANAHNTTGRDPLTLKIEKAWKLPEPRFNAGTNLPAAAALRVETASTASPPAPSGSVSAAAGYGGGAAGGLAASTSGLTASTSIGDDPSKSRNASGAVTDSVATLSKETELTSRLAQDKAPIHGDIPLAGGLRSGGAFANRELRVRLQYGMQSVEYQVRPNAEAYDTVAGSLFQSATAIPLSTFSIDVDTASYSNVRRFLNDGQLPPPAAVRLEELINYFPYALPAPADEAPFSITTEVSRAPWNGDHLLARIALKGRDIAADKLPPSNLVFLVDVSGSMRPENKLPLLKRSLRGLVQRLTPRDRVAIVVYAGSSGLALPSTSGEDQPRILDAIDRLESGGSTNGAAGIQLAYDTARQHFLEEGNNRVILCTDGDFNVGVTSQAELTRIIERERKSGVFLSVLGFGTGNVKDSTMESLADKGNGNYAYIDSPSEGRKVLVEQMGATLFTIAKDVKIQVEFNPATVAGYRLLGYENRLLAKEDFNDDTKDAGEIGAGHTVTALYEIVPAGQRLPNDRTVDPLKYQTPDAAIDPDNSKSQIQSRSEAETGAANPKSSDLFTVKLRAKDPASDTSKLVEKVVSPAAAPFEQASADLRFASAVAAFGMKLRADQADASLDWDVIQKIARGSLGEDPGTYRAEFLTLVEKAKQLSRTGGD